MAETVLVIGAGASYDYGLPTGSELIGEICKLTDSIYKLYNLQNYDPNADLNGRLLAALWNISSDVGFKQLSGQQLPLLKTLSRSLWLAKSIDNYINDQQDEALTFLGKVSISATILQAERNGRITRNKDTQATQKVSLLTKKVDRVDTLSFANIRDSWLIDFFREFRGQVRRNELGYRLRNICIVNFNYDRCMEHFLYHAFMEYDQLDSAEAAKIVSRIEIIHPYGTVGQLPWQSNGTGTTVLDYGQIDNGNCIAQAALGIKTFEESSDLDIIKRVRSRMHEAARIGFLGFGYHKQNMELLGINEFNSDVSKHHREIFATTRGLSARRTQMVFDDLLSMAIGSKSLGYTAEDGHDLVKLTDGDCKDFFFQFGNDLFN